MTKPKTTKAKPSARKTAPKAKARRPAPELAAAAKTPKPKAAVAKAKTPSPEPAAPPAKTGFMWKLLERKQAKLEARKLARVETPYENPYTHLNPQNKKTG